MFALMLLPILPIQTPAFDFDVRAGLKVSVSGIPVITGSWLQYYEDGWTKGYYSTSNNPPPVKKVDADTYSVEFSGYSGQATGLVTYHRAGEHLKVHYDLHWAGDKPAKIELTAGMISAQVMEKGTLTADGKPTRSMAAMTYVIPGLSERRYSPDASSYLFDAPLAQVGVSTSSPTTLFDARRYDQDYAEGKSLFWLGHLGLDVSKDKPVSFDVDWQFHPAQIPEPKTASITLTSLPAKGVVTPDERPPLIIPQPKTNQLKFDTPLLLSGNYDYPAGRVRFWDSDFIAGLQRRFELPPVDKKGAVIHVDGGVSKIGFHPGGYQITITGNSISVLGEEDEGYHNGLRRLAQLAFPHAGRIALPTGYLSSNPQIVWRGVHLFVGPEARSFQKKLWDRVLLPLGFNKVVLQCERTEWDTLPNLHGVPGVMTKPDLAGLFADYRAIGVEPIPLIQSFGHMEWFFEKNQNLDVAVNPNVPYTIDPRKSKSKEMLTALWDEACDLLQPSTIHFGCDEVDMLGFPTDDAGLVTHLWVMQMQTLKEISAKHGAQMMLWGDKALAPGEAIDATNGDTGIEAIQRRAAIPKGALIADWHYKPDPKIESYLPSLQLWKKEGFKPIASAWYQPEDVRGMDLAADVEKCGTLQTTWSGYYSDEKSFIENLNQFSAMVLAADFSWSTRYDKIGHLGYDPAEVLRELYFGKPRPLTPSDGVQVYMGDPKRDLIAGDYRFKLGDPLALRSLLSAPRAPVAAEMSLQAKGKHLAFALDSADRGDDGEVIANLTVEGANGKALLRQPLAYGRQVRASDDPGMSPYAARADGLSVFELDLPATLDIRGIRIETASARGGLRLHGIVIW